MELYWKNYSKYGYKTDVPTCSSLYFFCGNWWWSSAHPCEDMRKCETANNNRQKVVNDFAD